jgi:DNA-binding LytR/AlgR family response regulator
VIHQAPSGAEAIRLLTREPVDAAFLDIHMPGLTGFDLARALQRFERRPALVFVTADEDSALEAFDLAAVDYLLKPVRTERLQRSVTRIIEALRAQAAPATDASASARPELIAVTLGGTTRMIRRDDVRYVQAQGDYARLHTEEASYLVRVPMSDLERQWSDAFVRIHRSYLVAIPHLARLRLAGDHPSVTVGGAELPVSRRLLPALRERLETATIRPRS